jgi:hypothetical protein
MECDLFCDWSKIALRWAGEAEKLGKGEAEL